MSGPTLGRLMKADLGSRFVSANLPMLHTRTLDATGEAEFRPGVVTQADTIDLADEFERQFWRRDAVQRRAADRRRAFRRWRPVHGDALAATLDAVRDEMALQYRARHVEIVTKLDDTGVVSE